jgi:ParB/RepB/Spo0J family partition protein
MTDDTITALPIAQLRESPFNPRKTFANAGLQELADSISAVGVQQPIKVRSVAGGEAWEVVFGHRRLRAAALAGLASMPCMVCTMTDAEAARAQIAENLEREDLHPIEEAEGYAALMQDHGVTADELVQQTGKSRSYIYGRLKLLQACPQIRNACLAGEIGSEVALLIARLRTDKLQEKALGYIQRDYSSNLQDGGKSSYRSVRNLLNEKFTLELKGALFDTTDDTLLPDAGPCTTCPKRTANAPEFTDIAAPDNTAKDRYGMRKDYIPHDGPDVCTDPDCFAAKKAAHLKRKAAELQAKGKTVVDGNKARSAISAHGEVKGAYVALKDVRDAIKQAKGDKPATVTIQDPRTGKTVEAVKRSDLAAAGVKLKEPKATNSADSNRRWELQRQKEHEACEAETTRRLQLLSAVRERVATTARSEFDLRLLARAALDRVDHDDLRLLHQLWGMPDGDTLEDRVEAMDANDLTRLLMDCTLVDGLVVTYFGYIKTTPKPLAAAIAFYGVEQAAAPTPSKAARAPKKPAPVATEEAATA